MPYSLSAPLGALVWAVNDPMRLERQPRGSRRARRRGLSRTISRVERSAEWRNSLSELHALATSFRQGLDAAQLEQWLVLEEALLAHSERSSRAYYDAGFRCGVEWRARSRASRGEAKGSRLSPGEAREVSSDAGRDAASVIRGEAEAVVAAGADCVAAFARLLLAAAKR